MKIFESYIKKKTFLNSKNVYEMCSKNNGIHYNSLTVNCDI